MLPFLIVGCVSDIPCLFILCSFASLKHNAGEPNDKNRCKTDLPMGVPGNLKEDITVSYTYDIDFVPKNEVKWSSRWDYILDSMPHSNIQWFRWAALH